MSFDDVIMPFFFFVVAALLLALGFQVRAEAVEDRALDKAPCAEQARVRKASQLSAGCVKELGLESQLQVQRER